MHTKMKYYWLLLLLLPTTLLAQEKTGIYDIKNAGNDQKDKCKEYLTIYKNLPIEVRYTTQIIDDEVFFFFPSQKYFDLIFDKKSDGIAIDIHSEESNIGALF